MTDQTRRAEVVLPSKKLSDDMGFFGRTLGFRLETIYPADDPAVAEMSGHGLRIRLDRTADLPPGRLRILGDEPRWRGAAPVTAPNGTVIEFAPLTPEVPAVDPVPEFGVRRLRDNAPRVIGRAGMQYRDLIPSRLGGSIIASHIRIPDGGPVPDMVHYHTVGFQLIFCYRGWVDVLYEDQGDGMLRLTAGDCVIQPPEIRHRVCHASPDIEVIEIGVPAEHVTTIDHEMVLPNGQGDPAREWQGQRFVHHIRDRAPWQPFRIPGFTCQDTGIAAGTGGVANIQVARFDTGTSPATRHDSAIHFTFLMDGTMVLQAEGQPDHALGPGDAFVIPPGLAARYADCTPDLQLLEAALPGRFRTDIL